MMPDAWMVRLRDAFYDETLLFSGYNQADIRELQADIRELRRRRGLDSNTGWRGRDVSPPSADAFKWSLEVAEAGEIIEMIDRVIRSEYVHDVIEIKEFERDLGYVLAGEDPPRFNRHEVKGLASLIRSLQEMPEREQRGRSKNEQRIIGVLLRALRDMKFIAEYRDTRERWKKACELEDPYARRMWTKITGNRLVTLEQRHMRAVYDDGFMEEVL